MNRKRWVSILDHLNPAEAITSERLASILNLSGRTVRNELKELRRILENEGAHLISKTNSGYILEIEDEEKFRAFLNRLKETDMIPGTSEERVQYLLEMLLLNGEEYVKLEKLCDRLYISRTSLTADLKEVRKLLEEYHLRLATRPGYGIRIEGKEFDIRLCLAACILTEGASNLKRTQIAQCLRSL